MKITNQDKYILQNALDCFLGNFDSDDLDDRESIAKIEKIKEKIENEKID